MYRNIFEISADCRLSGYGVFLILLVALYGSWIISCLAINLFSYSKTSNCFLERLNCFWKRLNCFRKTIKYFRDMIICNLTMWVIIKNNIGGNTHIYDVTA